MKTLLNVVLGTAIVAMSSLAQAVPVTYFGENLNPGNAVSGDPVTARNAFLANLTGVGNEDFEGIASGTPTPIALTFPGSAGNITATLSGTGNIENLQGAGRFATSGSNWFETSGLFSIDFSDPISAFGFYGTDIGDFSGSVTLGLAGGGNVDLVIPHTVNGPNGSLLFFGFIDEAQSYTSISFGNTAAGTDFFGFDDMVIGDAEQIRPTPAPATLLLMGLGLAGIGFGRKKK